MEKVEPVPYWRLSAFYLVYFSALGVLVPYWGLYLQSLGFDARQIGELIAIIMATKIVAPYIWGWIGDHTGKGMWIVRLASVLSFVIFALIFVEQSYGWLAFVMVSFSFFWNAALPQFEATTMNFLGADEHNYSKIRVWGSLGFVAAVAIMGLMLEHHAISMVPVVLLVLYAALMLSSFLVPVDTQPLHKHQQGSILLVLKQPQVIALLVICFLVQFSHGPYYTFYSIYLQEHDYQSSMIGALWALGVIAEVVVFLYIHRWLPKYGHRDLLIVALLLTTARWLLIAYMVQYPSVMVFAQLLHAASFGVFHAVAISLFHQTFVGKHQGRGQALYASVSFGAGGAAGSLLSGLSWQGLGSTQTFLIAAAIVFMAALLTRRYIKS
ncbi:MAG: MFS transporter [Gammaproteobacteria bacterium]|nr:MFS transporter [Gammaproteobacteria bacterium]